MTAATGPVARWAPTHAHLRAVTVAVGCLLAAAVGGRPDIAVLGLPFVAVAAWGERHRPRAPVTASLDVAGRTLFEGQATTVAITVEAVDRHRDAGDAPGATSPRARRGEGATGDLVAVAVRTGPWLAATPPAATVAADRAAVTSTVEVPVRAVRWGRHEVAARRVAATSNLGAYRADMTAPGPLVLTTLPIGADFAPVEVVPRPAGSVGMHRSHRLGPGGELAEVRPFRPGDRLRRINWAVSSRTGTLHVTSTWADRDTEVLLLLDTEHDVGVSEGVDGRASSLDTAVRAAAAIAEHSLRAGDRVRVVDLGRRVGDVRPGTGLRQLRRVLDVLVMARPSTDHRPAPVRVPRLPAGALVVVLSPLVGRTAVAEIAHLVQHGRTVVVVDTLPPDLPEPASAWRALAGRLRVLERTMELERLGALGVPVVPWRGRGTLDDVLRGVARVALAPRVTR